MDPYQFFTPNFAKSHFKGIVICNEKEGGSGTWHTLGVGLRLFDDQGLIVFQFCRRIFKYQRHILCTLNIAADF